MVEPIYVPVLPTRRNAWDAYARLTFGVRRRIAPLWTVVPRVEPERTRGVRPVPDPDTDEAELRRWFTRRMDNLINAVDGLTGRVDICHVESHLDATAVGLWHVATGSRLRLVTGPERDPTHQRYAADLAFLSGHGIGIRVLLDGPRDQPLSTDLLDLIDRLCLPPSRLDLILDAGPVADGGDIGKRALAALDLLGVLVPWRTIVLTSGAFPRALDHLDAQPTRVLQRHDWQLYRSVRDARPESLTSLVYGDYSVEHALSANIASVRRPGPPWGLLRYTTPDGFLITRAPTRGSDRAARVRAMARWIVRADSFRGIDAIASSDGERWLHACAYGDGPDGSGNAETWIRVGHAQHMNFVVSQLTDTA
ncbi:beta family protein [Streptomyces iranensis]|uniref:beta family protein n=1 Tax=Streptomyces iranensis TaxID=576784 RepID=UPI0039B77927